MTVLLKTIIKFLLYTVMDVELLNYLSFHLLRNIVAVL